MIGITSQENGVIGEARTKEILIDRFWILERSVDIEGADHIIQPKIFHRNMIDAEPVRVGYVQSKYRKDLSKSSGFSDIKIKEDYAFDNLLRPRNEFFLFIHTGIEDNKEFYFFTAMDLLDSNIFSYDEENSEYVLKVKAILSDFKYTISDTLEKITENLNEAIVKKNKEFLLDFFTDKKSKRSLTNEDKYSLNLYQGHDKNNIETLFQEYKKELADIIKEYFHHGVITMLIDLIQYDSPEGFFKELKNIYENNTGHEEPSKNLKKGYEKIIELGSKIEQAQINNLIENYNETYDKLKKVDALEKFIDIKAKIPVRMSEAVRLSGYINTKFKKDIFKTEIKIKLKDKITIPPKDFRTEKFDSKKISPFAQLLVTPNCKEGLITVTLVWGIENYKLNYHGGLSTEEALVSTIENELESRWPEFAQILIKHY